jgi:hypothetical protein
VVSLLLSNEVRDHQRLRERAGVEVSAQSVVPGHPAVRAIAESGEIIVFTTPAPSPYVSRPSRPGARGYSGARPTRRVAPNR